MQETSSFHQTWLLFSSSMIWFGRASYFLLFEVCLPFLMCL
uniref:Macaca fascicularis brain cDNA clone: QtrA-16655, similar to human hypothetical protein LOC93380 (LOC93380), mRNA, RefSeq: NM_173470.1 n=1 Tax=Macaca fascicularis TaxID=9541 RepID=I7G9H3_MACFA|nr:unnamed protein product [Macaca fascicularis]